MTTDRTDWEMIAFSVLTETATAAQQDEFEALVKNEADFRDLVAELQVFLAEDPPSETPAAPPIGVFDEIMAEIDASTPERDVSPVAHPRPATSAGVWPALTGLAALVAIIAVGSHFIPGSMLPAESEPGISVLSDASAPQVIVLIYDRDSQRIIARYQNVDLPSEQVWQLWLIPEGETLPRSVGIFDVMEGAGDLGLPLDQPLANVEGTFAISLEPPGGAPGEAPTGPILFTGKASRL